MTGNQNLKFLTTSRHPRHSPEFYPGIIGAGITHVFGRNALPIVVEVFG